MLMKKLIDWCRIILITEMKFILADIFFYLNHFPQFPSLFIFNTPKAKPKYSFSFLKKRLTQNKVGVHNSRRKTKASKIKKTNGHRLLLISRTLKLNGWKMEIESQFVSSICVVHIFSVVFFSSFCCTTTSFFIYRNKLCVKYQCCPTWKFARLLFF